MDEHRDDGTLFDMGEFGDEVVQEADRGDDAFARLATEREEESPSGPLGLSRIRLKNILGFEDATIYPEQFSVLVGTNNSGKSTLMRAVAFGQTLLRVHFERRDKGEVVLAMGRNLDDSLLPVPEVRDLWYRGIRRSGNEWIMAEIELEFEDGRSIGFGMKGPFGHATSRLLGSRRMPRATYDRLTSFPIVVCAVFGWRCRSRGIPNTRPYSLSHCRWSGA